MLALQASSWIADYSWIAVLSGLVALVIGADLLVRGAVWIALVVGMSRIAVGLTLVAIGTSLPELLVTLTAGRSGKDAMAMANVLGSNASNTLLIIGSAAAICAIRIEVRWLELVYMLIATALLAVPFALGTPLEPWIAGPMLAMLIVFCWQLMIRERRNAALVDEEIPTGRAAAWVLNVAILLLGFCGLQYGAEWLVGGAVVIGKDFGMSDPLVGVTILAIGTSLPELATSAMAALKRQPEICIGNIVGSNIFNVGAVLGIAGLLHLFPVDRSRLWLVMTVTAVSAVLLVAVLRVCKGVPKTVGWLFLLAYAGFLTAQAMLTPPE